jgi:polyisoprenoid-binding protein YceI
VFSGSVGTRTIDTNNWLRSRHLRARKYFNASDFPKITFNSTSVSGTKDRFQVSGSLVIKGVENTVLWKFENDGKHLTGTTTINSRDYDISIHDDKIRNKVTLTVILPYK